ncbi:MAG: nucleoside 2-deoxyribosyltransferase [Ignavibacteria bacterium]|nr:nucleoside 2-deoxyribosyltransferase [Ignavibacteria bacterium]
MNIYYATSIRGTLDENSGRINKFIIETLRKHGNVLTEHFANLDKTAEGETELTDKQIHDRDIDWISQSDLIVAEVTNPSLGVGYEIARGLQIGKKVVCLKANNGKRLSAMIAGCADIDLIIYNNESEIEDSLDIMLSRTK